MRYKTSIISKSNYPGRAALAFLAIYGLFYIFNPNVLHGKNFKLIRHGVMVDSSVCESAIADIDYDRTKTGFFDLCIERGVDLNLVQMRLNRRFIFVDTMGYTGDDTRKKISRRLDAICIRAMQILDMKPVLNRPAIIIFSSREQLNDVFRRLTGREKRVRAFYSHDCSTIYTSQENISDSVIAHEIAHAIVDTHYKGIPPQQIGDTLASYVDLHL